MRYRRVMTSIALAVGIGMLIPAAAASANPGGGNSGAAHMCQHHGYLSLVGSHGETFTTVGDCVSFAAHDGQFATGKFIVPAGKTLTLSGAHWVNGPCDVLTYGYQVDFGANVAIASKTTACANAALAGAVVGPFPTAVLVRVFLNDVGFPPFVSCNVTSYNDGVRALVTGSNPYTVGIKDSIFCAEGANTPFNFLGNPANGNLEVTVTIS